MTTQMHPAVATVPTLLISTLTLIPTRTLTPPTLKPSPAVLRFLERSTRLLVLKEKREEDQPFQTLPPIPPPDPLPHLLVYHPSRREPRFLLLPPTAPPRLLDILPMLLPFLHDTLHRTTSTTPMPWPLGRSKSQQNKRRGLVPAHNSQTQVPPPAMWHGQSPNTAPSATEANVLMLMMARAVRHSRLVPTQQPPTHRHQMVTTYLPQAWALP
jgi:hypothetical protein